MRIKFKINFRPYFDLKTFIIKDSKTNFPEFYFLCQKNKLLILKVLYHRYSI